MRIRLHHLGSVDSTNERAFAELKAGSAEHGDLYVAREQTAGRGRRGAAWVSPPDTGLYASLVLLPAERPHPAVLTMSSGLAVLRTVRGLGLAAAALKWPNDVLVRGAKLAGILVETRGPSGSSPRGSGRMDPGRMDPGPGDPGLALPFVVGIGLNVAQREFPPELTAARPVTSLAREGLELTPEEVLPCLVGELGPAIEEALGDPRTTAGAYVNALGLLGHPIRVRMADRTLEGTLRGLDLERGVQLDGPSAGNLALEHVLGIESLGAGRAGP